MRSQQWHRHITTSSSLQVSTKPAKASPHLRLCEHSRIHSIVVSSCTGAFAKPALQHLHLHEHSRSIHHHVFVSVSTRKVSITTSSFISKHPSHLLEHPCHIFISTIVCKASKGISALPFPWGWIMQLQEKSCSIKYQRVCTNPGPKKWSCCTVRASNPGPMKYYDRVNCKICNNAIA
jgi:hypothetical protein